MKIWNWKMTINKIILFKQVIWRWFICLQLIVLCTYFGFKRVFNWYLTKRINRVSFVFSLLIGKCCGKTITDIIGRPSLTLSKGILTLSWLLCLLFSMEETSSWSDLPQYLAELILKHLSVPNYLSFGSVCRSWCPAQRECPHLLGPLFIVFYSNVAAARGIIEILSLPDQRIYKMPVRLNLPFSCVSSSHGWMLLQTINRCILVKNNEYVNLPTGFCYLDCLFFSTPSYPDGILFVRNSTNKFLLYQRCDRRFDEYHWNGTAVSNTIFHEGKLYTLLLMLVPNYYGLV